MFSKVVNISELTDTAPLYTTAQCRQLDSQAIEEGGIPGIVLMKRAARAAFSSLLDTWPSAEKLIIFCGGGNNGGDGFLLASMAVEKRLATFIVLLGDPLKLKGDAKLAYEHVQGICETEKNRMTPDGDPLIQILSFEDLNELKTNANSIIVDALLGTGINGAPKAKFASAINWINKKALPVLSIDVPSGLKADTGSYDGCAVKADLTVSVVGLKRGLFTARGPELAGDIRYADLEIPEHILNSQLPSAQLLTLPACQQWLPPRSLDSHKGDFGHVLVVGGDHGFGGAAMMAAEAAARAGAGLVSLATRQEHCLGMLARCPEVMVKAVESTSDLVTLIEKATVIVLGPGLGQSEWSKQMFKLVIQSELPLVVDADALNFLAEQNGSLSSKKNNWVLSPHPGEASRLLSMSTGEVQEDRFASAEKLQSQYQCVALLKGRGTLVASESASGEKPIAVASVGNPGMASGGMGDILSGVIGGLLAQGLDCTKAATLGVMLHGHAADLAAQLGGQRGMLATDLLPHLRRLVNP